MVWEVWLSSKEKDVDKTVGRLREEARIEARRVDLPVCDVAFVLNGRTYVHAEIKTPRDLVASITVDCRYQEQSAAMAESGVPYTFYLLTGYTISSVTEEEREKIQHAMTRVQLAGSLCQVSPEGAPKRTHVSLVPLTGPDPVYRWICYVHRQLVEDPTVTDGVTAPLSDNVKHNYGTKPANRDQARVYVEQLSRITGVSEDRARALAAVYPSMKSLISFLCDVPDARTLTEHLRSLNLKMGPKTAERLYTQMLAPDETRIDFKNVKKRKVDDAESK